MVNYNNTIEVTIVKNNNKQFILYDWKFMVNENYNNIIEVTIVKNNKLQQKRGQIEHPDCSC